MDTNNTGGQALYTDDDDDEDKNYTVENRFPYLVDICIAFYHARLRCNNIVKIVIILNIIYFMGNVATISATNVKDYNNNMCLMYCWDVVERRRCGAATNV